MAKCNKPAKHWFGVQPGPGNPDSGPAETYTLSGQITDIEDAAIEGVLVTLSGDDTGTDTTDASGDYSFTVEAGSYTLTPSKAELEFTPASTNETVVDTNVTAASMQGHLALPRQLVWTSGDLNEKAKAGTYTVQNITADNNSYTPGGFTKEVYANMDGDANDFITFDIGSGQFAIDNLAAPNGIKIEILGYAESTLAAMGLLLGDKFDTRANMFVGDSLYGRCTDDADQIQVAIRKDPSTALVNDESAATSRDVRRWFKYRIYADHTAETVGASVTRVEDSATSNNNGHAYSDTWVTMALDGLRYMMPYHYQNLDIHIARIWVGDHDDDWP
jgi:hypothetical protein